MQIWLQIESPKGRTSYNLIQFTTIDFSASFTPHDRSSAAFRDGIVFGCRAKRLAIAVSSSTAKVAHFPCRTYSWSWADHITSGHVKDTAKWRPVIWQKWNFISSAATETTRWCRSHASHTHTHMCGRKRSNAENGENWHRMSAACRKWHRRKRSDIERGRKRKRERERNRLRSFNVPVNGHFTSLGRTFSVAAYFWTMPFCERKTRTHTNCNVKVSTDLQFLIKLI